MGQDAVWRHTCERARTGAGASGVETREGKFNDGWAIVKLILSHHFLLDGSDRVCEKAKKSVLFVCKGPEAQGCLFT